MKCRERKDQEEDTTPINASSEHEIFYHVPREVWGNHCSQLARTELRSK